jgi:hypothetical protein
LTPTTDPAEAKRMIETLMGKDVVEGHRVPDWFQYRQASGELYRADNRPIEQVFAEGFQARGTHNSIGLHVAGVPGQYVSFTKRMQMARDWHEMSALQRPDGTRGTGNGGVFVVRGKGVDIDYGVSGANTPEANRAYMMQSEVAIAGGVAPQDILGAYIVDEDSPTGYRFVRNHAAGPSPDASTTSTLAPEGNFPSANVDQAAGGEAMRGDIALTRGDYDAAEAHFKKVLETEPNNTRAVWGLERINAEREHRPLRPELFYEAGTKMSAQVMSPKPAAPAARRSHARDRPRVRDRDHARWRAAHRHVEPGRRARAARRCAPHHRAHAPVGRDPLERGRRRGAAPARRHRAWRPAPLVHRRDQRRGPGPRAVQR